MRQAVWLYLYLLMVSNWKTGILYRKIFTIIKETVLNKRTIQHCLRVLREKGYIETRSTGRSLQISITKWRPIRSSTAAANYLAKANVKVLPGRDLGPGGEGFVRFSLNYKSEILRVTAKQMENLFRKVAAPKP